MGGMKRVLLLIVIMTAVASGVAFVTLQALYHAAFEQQRERLTETVQSRTRLLEAILRHEEDEIPLLHDTEIHGDPVSVMLDLVRESHQRFEGFGETGEFTLAMRQDDEIVFLLSHRHHDLENLHSVVFHSELAEPMRRALSGQSGTLISLDYRGEPVLAAHEPVTGRNLGVVAKIDLAEIRAPFLNAGLLAGSVGLLFIAAGTALFLRIGGAMVRHLEENERRYRGLFESAADMLLLVDLDGTILDVNPAACAAHGYPPEALIGRSISMLLDPDHHRLIATAAAAAEGNSATTESKGVRKDGTSLAIEVRMSPLLHEGRTVIIWAVRDISERKRTEEALRKRTHDLGERIKELNCLYGISRFAARPSVSPSQMIQRTVELIPPAWQYPEITCAQITVDDQVFRTGNFKATARKQASEIKVDGEHVGAVEVHYLEERPEADEGPFLSEERALIGAISERLGDYVKSKRIEEALQGERDNLATIYEAMKDGAYVVGDDHEIQYVNPALEASFGPWNGQKCYEYFADRDSVCPSCKAPEVLAGKTVRWEWHHSKTDRIYDIVATPLGTSVGGYRKLEIWRDITERKAAEQKLKDLNEKLEQRVAERTATIESRATQLRTLAAELTQAEQRERRRLARILHDHLQQLLWGGKLTLGSLMNSTLPRDKLKRDLRKIDQVLAESLRASKSLTIELYPPVLNSKGLTLVLEWLASWMEEQHGLTVDFEVDGEVDTVDDDIRNLLFQAVRELLFNVTKHAKVDRAKLHASRPSPDRIQIVVSDRGAGFDPAQARAAVDRGSAFGLFSIRERMESFGGQLNVSSSPGAGSCMTLIAPIGQAQAESRTEPSSDTGIRPEVDVRDLPIRPSSDDNRRIRILLVDDHPIVRQGLAGLLQDEPDMVVMAEACNGQEAIELARRTKPDVIIMDVSMPLMDGEEATRRITAELPSVRIIGMSMYEDRATGMREAGAVDCLNKGGPSEALIAAIRDRARVSRS